MKKTIFSLNGAAIVALAFCMTNGINYTTAASTETKKFATLEQATEVYIAQCTDTNRETVCVDHSYFGSLGSDGLKALEQICTCAVDNDKALIVANMPLLATPGANASAAHYVFTVLQASGVTLTVTNKVDLTVHNLQPYAQADQNAVFVNAQTNTPKAEALAELNKTYPNLGIAIHITSENRKGVAEFISSTPMPVFIPVPAAITTGTTAHHTIDPQILSEYVSGRTAGTITVFAVITGTPPSDTAETQKWITEVRTTSDTLQTVMDEVAQEA